MRIRARKSSTKNRLFFQITLMLTALVAVFSLMGFFQTENFKNRIGLLFGGESRLETRKSAWVWCPQGLREIKHLPTNTVIHDAHQMATLCSINITPSSSEEIEHAKFEFLLKAVGPNSEVAVEASQTGDLFRISGLAFHSKNFRAQLDKLK